MIKRIVVLENSHVYSFAKEWILVRQCSYFLDLVFDIFLKDIKDTVLNRLLVACVCSIGPLLGG